MTRSAKGHAYIEKAEKYLRWCKTEQTNMRALSLASERDELERQFVGILSKLATILDALDSAANCMKWLDLRSVTSNLRDADPHVRYVWLARNVATHDLFVVRDGSAVATLEVKDADRVNWLARLFRHPLYPGRELQMMGMLLFGASTSGDVGTALGENALPDAARASSMGYKVLYGAQTLELADFEARPEKGPKVLVKAPVDSNADHCVDTAIRRLQVVCDMFSERLVATGNPT